MTVDQRIDLVLDEGRVRSAALGPEYALLWDGLDRATRGGKRFRPALAAEAHAAFGGTAHDALDAVGAALELLHTAFVVHDDVIDGDEVRRGHLNVNGTFAAHARLRGVPDDRADTLARTAGILAGDLALVAATRTLALASTDAGITRRLLDLLDHAVHVTAAGELTDVAYAVSAEPPSLGDVLTMAERKTAVYSFELPLQAGAVLAGASDADVARLGLLGSHLGLAFQLLDDLQGVFGDEAETGKSSLTDLREGKSTALVAHARTTAVWPRLARFVGDPGLTREDADVARALLVESGSRRFVDGLVTDALRAAAHLAHDLGLAEPVMSWIGTTSVLATEHAA